MASPPLLKAVANARGHKPTNISARVSWERARSLGFVSQTTRPSFSGCVLFKLGTVSRNRRGYPGWGQLSARNTSLNHDIYYSSDLVKSWVSA